MRLALVALLLATFAAFDAGAQSTARPRPPGTMPLEEAPPPPVLDEDPEPGIQPQVTTRQEGGQTIQEYRINGRLYMQRITPAHGRPYVLIDNRGDGTFTRMDNTLDNRVRVPQWVIKEF
jgi:uncharacterized protein DUF2782